MTEKQKNRIITQKNKSKKTIIKNEKKNFLKNCKTVNDKEFSSLVSTIAKVGKGIFHPNKISRMIARLSKKRRTNE